MCLCPVRPGYLDCVLGDIKSTTGKRRGRVSVTQGSKNAEDNPNRKHPGGGVGSRGHGEVGE